MMDQVVQFLTTDYETVTSYRPSSFELREDRPHVWLQKIAVWILRKLGCFAVYTDKICVKKALDTGDFANQLIRQQNEIMRDYHYNGMRLLVGYEEFQKLNGFHVGHPLSFSCQYIWQEVEQDFDKHKDIVRRTANGLEVTVIPWMKGFLVIPKDFE